MLLGIPMTKVVQEPGEVVYLSPGAIHYGFNRGVNINRYRNLQNMYNRKKGYKLLVQTKISK